MHGVTGNNARHTTTEINMKVSFVLDNETTDYMAECRSIVSTYYKDGVEIWLSVSDLHGSNGAPESGTYVRYADGRDEFFFD
jgi:hypothetical protein